MWSVLILWTNVSWVPSSFRGLGTRILMATLSSSSSTSGNPNSRLSVIDILSESDLHESSRRSRTEDSRSLTARRLAFGSVASLAISARSTRKSSLLRARFERERGRGGGQARELVKKKVRRNFSSAAAATMWRLLAPTAPPTRGSRGSRGAERIQREKTYLRPRALG